MCKIALAQEFKLLNLLRLQNVFRRQLGFVLGSEGGQNNSEENSAQGYFDDVKHLLQSNIDKEIELRLFCGKIGK